VGVKVPSPGGRDKKLLSSQQGVPKFPLPWRERVRVRGNLPLSNYNNRR